MLVTFYGLLTPQLRIFHHYYACRTHAKIAVASLNNKYWFSLVLRIIILITISSIRSIIITVALITLPLPRLITPSRSSSI
jgi:hypothetical protein